MKRIVLIVILAIIVIGGIVAYRIYNRPHRDVTKEKAIELTADQIYKDYIADEAAANSKYLNKAIQVTGEISDIQHNQDSSLVVYLKTSDPSFGVNCEFKTVPEDLQVGQQIRFRGVCTGYNGADVALNQGLIIK